MTTPAKSPSEEALDDILKEFAKLRIEFSFSGREKALQLFNESLGKYLRRLEQINTKNVWSDPELAEMPAFILGNVVAEIARQLKREPGGGVGVDEPTIERVAKGVMRSKKTLADCRIMVDSYERKVQHLVDPTPICSVETFLS